jgi:hypothetical protein
LDWRLILKVTWPPIMANLTINAFYKDL